MNGKWKMENEVISLYRVICQTPTFNISGFSPKLIFLNLNTLILSFFYFFLKLNFPEIETDVFAASVSVAKVDEY